MKKVFSIDFQLFKVTGVEKVMLDIHHAIQGDYEAKIVGNIPYAQVRPEHNIKKEEYLQKKSWFMFHNSIVVVHERRLLWVFWLLNHLFFQKIKIVYIHHNIFHNHKLSTILPKTIVAIADSGIKNLTLFFNAPKRHIHKIYNCVVDKYEGPHAPIHRNKITLLLPGRINNQKQQLEIVRHLSGRLDPRIKILFAGDGPMFEELLTLCKGDNSFEVLGFRNDVKDLMKNTDFIFLFSAHEGLPITLIEATMVGMPIVCNDVGGNSEICCDGENGWVVNDWEALIEIINNLPNVSDEKYISMCEKSREIYKHNFSFELFKDKYLQLFNSL
ncbi:glycosyltransferase family 4 protein [Prevotella communis]|uniref:glycosyltransferase family 4 protein n=1 Tax=Prevotella communis TaxID=2913614 RepID=UPI001EDAFBF0|nr:glycosyltransferase family 4 protein [Prevotella communis]UKK59600.1 glycosyltransferase family 4 protein [Prevotella communis]